MVPRSRPCPHSATRAMKTHSLSWHSPAPHPWVIPPHSSWEWDVNASISWHPNAPKHVFFPLVCQGWQMINIYWTEWNSFLLPYPLEVGFPGGSDGKESACNAGDLGSVPGLERSPGGWHSNLLQYSSLENSMDRGAWWTTVHRVTKSWTRHERLCKRLSTHTLWKQ